jgi:hypothetical protein|nr:MAG TPA: hypothetical protein [Caudoviricetes sp.]
MIVIQKPNLNGYEQAEGYSDLMLAYDQLEEHVAEVLKVLKAEEERIVNNNQIIIELIK